SPSKAVVRKIFLPQTIGDEWPRPSSGVFHFTFLVALHSLGNPVSVETPCPSGPRHCGQFPVVDFPKAEFAEATIARSTKAKAMRPKIFMSKVSFELIPCRLINTLPFR